MTRFWRTVFHSIQFRVLRSVVLALIVGQSDLLMIVIVSNGAVGSATSPRMAVMATLAVLPCQWQLKWATLAEVMPWLRDGNCAFALCPIVGGRMIKRQQSYYLPPLLLIDSATAAMPAQFSRQQSALFWDDLLTSTVNSFHASDHGQNWGEHIHSIMPRPYRTVSLSINQTHVYEREGRWWCER